VNEYPRGYPNLAAFLDSDESFMIYRRFGYLQARLLLDKQDELRRLEERLGEMDEEATGLDHDELCTRDRRGKKANARKALLENVEEKFCSYGKTSMLSLR